jgi:putative ABC transport system substrate-binding protein
MAHAVTEVKRRELIKLLGGVAAYPLLGSRAARAQQAMPVVGFMRGALGDDTQFLTTFRDGLKEAGFIEGQNVAIEVRSADDDPDRLSALATDLVRRPVAVFVGNLAPALAAKAASTTVPVLFVTGSDPVRDGLVASLNRPGGDVTGVSFLSGTLGAKRLELLRQFVPKADMIAMLMNPNLANTEAERRDVQAAAQALGQKLIVFNVSGAGDIEPAFAEALRQRADALLVGAGAFMVSNRRRVVALAAHHLLPAGYAWRDAAVLGGLMSYGPSITEAYRQAGLYAGRILRGEKPANLPVMQSSKFEFVVNLKTAKTLGLEFHPQLLATADEVIE